jgi:hypothetical protein
MTVKIHCIEGGSPADESQTVKSPTPNRQEPLMKRLKDYDE